MSNQWLRIVTVTITLLMFSETTRGEHATLPETCQQFEDYTGARLVFRRRDLPTGNYYDVIKPLDRERCQIAASLCLAECKKYPVKYFGKIGLKTIGIFASCSSMHTDGFRPYDERLGGYRYFGIYNRTDAIAMAFYSRVQLPQTFHHEVFHHVDATVDGITETWQLASDDAKFQSAVDGRACYPSVEIPVEKLDALRQRARGAVLSESVGEYSKRNLKEDQAETAQYMMANLPDALIQISQRPELPGSQRMLHVLKEYQNAVQEGPDQTWFVEVALRN